MRTSQSFYVTVILISLTSLLLMMSDSDINSSSVYAASISVTNRLTIVDDTNVQAVLQRALDRNYTNGAGGQYRVRFEKFYGLVGTNLLVQMYRDQLTIEARDIAEAAKTNALSNFNNTITE